MEELKAKHINALKSVIKEHTSVTEGYLSLLLQDNEYLAKRLKVSGALEALLDILMRELKK